mgnify:CR=1 FL=1
MAKKYDLPAMPFYFGDWMKAPDIRALPLDVRMVWFEMLGFMWESEERGYLTINKRPIPEKNLALMLGLPEDLLKQILKQLSDFAIYSIRESDGAIYNRKMVKDNDIREKRQKAGFIGGKHSFASRLAQAKSEANTEYEYEDEIENEIVIKTIKNRKEQILEYCKVQDYLQEEGESFFDYYQALGWLTNAGIGIVDWKAKMRTWHKEQKTRKLNGRSKVSTGATDEYLAKSSAERFLRKGF